MNLKNFHNAWPSPKNGPRKKVRTAARQPRKAPIIPIRVTSPKPMASRRKTNAGTLADGLSQGGSDQQAQKADPEPLNVSQGRRRPGSNLRPERPQHNPDDHAGIGDLFGDLPPVVIDERGRDQEGQKHGMVGGRHQLHRGNLPQISPAARQSHQAEKPPGTRSRPRFRPRGSARRSKSHNRGTHPARRSSSRWGHCRARRSRRDRRGSVNRARSRSSARESGRYRHSRSYPRPCRSRRNPRQGSPRSAT